VWKRTRNRHTLWRFLERHVWCK